jgi:putative thioredoxin
MSKQALVFEVGESGFEQYVIENSRKLPVLLEFMGVWSEPCVVMAEIIQDLAREFAERFVFAKVDVEAHQGLRDQFSIQNVPTLLVFRDGEVIFRQEGQMHEDELRVLLKGVDVFHISDELREQARARHMAGDTPEAIMLMTQAIKQDPSNTRVAMDMVQIFIDMGELEQARSLYDRLPEADKESRMGLSLIGQLTFADLAAKTEGMEVLQQKLAQNADDHDARFDLVVCLVAVNDYDAAMDHLFTILKEEPDYKEGAAKEMIISIINTLAPNDPSLATSYRQRLSNQML